MLAPGPVIPAPPARPWLLQGLTAREKVLSPEQGANPAARRASIAPGDQEETEALGNPLRAAQEEHSHFLTGQNEVPLHLIWGDGLTAACSRGGASGLGRTELFLPSQGPMRPRPFPVAGHPFSPISRPRHL